MSMSKVTGSDNATRALAALLANNPELGVISGVEDADPAPSAAHIENQRRGRENQATGAAFQDELDIYHAGLTRSRTALVYRTDPAIRYAGDGLWRVVGKGPVDYLAITMDYVIGFDAKVRTGDAFSIGEVHQLAWLKDMASLDQLAGYLVRWSDYDEVRWHPVGTVDGKRVRRGEGRLCEGVRWLEVARVAA